MLERPGAGQRFCAQPPSREVINFPWGHRYVDVTLAVFHGPRKLAAYEPAECQSKIRRCNGWPREGPPKQTAIQSIESGQCICYQTGHFKFVEVGCISQPRRTTYELQDG